jgi:uncharacterized protein
MTESEPKPVEVREPALLVRINQLYRPGMSTVELYEATRGIWRLGGRRMEEVELALAVYHGVVREVYAVEEWHPAGTTPYSTRQFDPEDVESRWEFTGRVAPGEVRNRYLSRSVAHYFTAGNANPVKYVNIPT